ncbi:MAG: DNA primase, partial [Armatimonadota bacterium]
MADEIDEIRRRIDIVDLVSSRVQLKRAGKNFVGLCPFHDDKRPSFNVSPLIGRYTCWSCGAKGDIFNWVMETQKVDFAEALRILAAQAGVTLSSRGTTKKVDAGYGTAMADALDFYLSQMRLSKEATDYCDNRGLTDEVRAQWEIGFAPEMGDALARSLQKKGHSLAMCEEVFLVRKDAGGGYYDMFRGRMMVPIRDERGTLVAFGGRTVLKDGIPKYINSSDTPLFHKNRLLFGMDKAKEVIAKTKVAVLVEGYLDVVACHRAGVRNAVASLGTSLTEEQVKLLKRWCERVVVFYDGDTAGQNATERAADMLEPAGLGVTVVMVPAGDDPDTMLKDHGAASVVAAVSKSQPILDFRAWLLRQRHQPNDPDYWDLVAKVLAKAPNELEFLRLAPSFAAEFPGTRDKEAAVRALRKMAVDAKRG